MARPRRLSKAPITEAVFDFRVTLPADFATETLSGVYGQLNDRYPIKEEMRSFEAIFEVKAGKAMTPLTHSDSSAFAGFLFKSADGRNIAQFRRDGFTFNRLAPYTNWDELEPEALRLWSVYLASAKPDVVDRVALRYINRLRLPPQGNLETYLLVTPPSIPGAPAVLNSFLNRQSRHDPVSGYMGNIVQNLEANLGGDNTLLTVDIDVYKAGGLGMHAADLRRVLGDLRRLKNDIFFGMVTDTALEPYD